ncbi:MAG: DUF5678 domain-containing protein [Candidatus Aenigmatarchaeota archaeon]
MDNEILLIGKMEMDNQWVDKHISELQEKHTNEYIAVQEQKLIASGRNLQELIQILKNKGIDTTSVLVQFIPEKGMSIIF